MSKSTLTLDLDPNTLDGLEEWFMTLTNEQHPHEK